LIRSEQYVKQTTKVRLQFTALFLKVKTNGNLKHLRPIAKCVLVSEKIVSFPHYTLHEDDRKHLRSCINCIVEFVILFYCFNLSSDSSSQFGHKLDFYQLATSPFTQAYLYI